MPPLDADCAAGTTLETLDVHSGFWRTGPTSPKLKRCFQGNACVSGGGNASQCAPGYHKTLCASCEHNYYREVSTGECHKCDAAATRRTRHFFGLHLFLLLFFCASPFVVARFLRARAHDAAKRRFRSKRSERWWSRSAKALLPKAGRVVPDEETNTSRPPWGNNLVGTAVKVSVVGAWLNAEVVEVDTDQDGARGVFVRYTDYPSADEEFHDYESEDIMYLPRAQTPDATPERDDADLAREAPKIHLRELTNASLDLLVLRGDRVRAALTGHRRSRNSETGFQHAARLWATDVYIVPITLRGHAPVYSPCGQYPSGPRRYSSHARDLFWAPSVLGRCGR